MDIYHYHPTTGEYLGSGKADLDPLQHDNWLVPAFATNSTPPAVTDNHAPVYANGTWSLIEDHRGKTVYDKQTRQQQDVTELGPLADSVTELAPGHDDVWGIDGWQLDPAAITLHQKSKHAEINTWRNQQELATVEHNGQHWDADPTSRARIESVLLAGVMPLDYWTDASNQDQPMTLEQLRELYAAIVQQGGRIHDRQRTMKAEVNALTTIEAVQAYPVGWP
ncbi:DUF4376 domain-containing protein [Oceanisphaera sp. KMM 10153]|uniref:DUF4376 domain-containing protein n=1 Tax=Oceanisphaera submarina TaxID=3390193 RepID=UPI003975DA7D